MKGCITSEPCLGLDATHVLSVQDLHCATKAHPDHQLAHVLAVVVPSWLNATSFLFCGVTHTLTAHDLRPAHG